MPIKKKPQTEVIRYRKYVDSVIGTMEVKLFDLDAKDENDIEIPFDVYLKMLEDDEFYLPPKCDTCYLFKNGTDLVESYLQGQAAVLSELFVTHNEGIYTLMACFNIVDTYCGRELLDFLRKGRQIDIQIVGNLKTDENNVATKMYISSFHYRYREEDM